MNATYNITNDKVLVWFDERLSETDYERARQCKFVWYPGRKCFAAKWRPEAEDFVQSFGIEIEADDTPDNLEARVERFADRAEEAARSADSAENYLNERANTERRRKNALNSIDKNLSAAEHWKNRIEAAIRHATHKESTGVIMRRIRELEADRRYYEVRAAPPSGDPCWTDDSGEKCYWYGNNGRGGFPVAESRIPAMNRHAWRWLAHINDRLAYERASFEASGGTEAELHPERKKAVVPKGKPTDKEGNVAEVYGALGQFRGYSHTDIAWSLIVRVNRTTVEVLSDAAYYTNGDGATKKRYYVFKREFSPSYDKLKSAEQTAKDHPEFAEGIAFFKAYLERKKAAKTQQKKEGEVAA